MLWPNQSIFQRGKFMRQRIIVALVLAVMSASCQKKASGQTVAVVNNDEITASDLNAALSGTATNANSKDARNASLEKLIDRQLLVQQARSDGLDKSPEYLNQVRRASDDLLITMLISRKVNTAQVPSAEEISAFEASHPGMFANRETWTLDQIIFPIPKDPAVSAKLSAAKTLDDVVQALTAAGIQYTRANRKIDTALFPQEAYAQIAKAKPGEPFIAPGPDKAVANLITNREPNPLVGDQARAVALDAIRRARADGIAQDRVKELRAKAKIEYQPGFGPPAKK
jgi:peptidyl-prolyl cis-trans isomerase C